MSRRKWPTCAPINPTGVVARLLRSTASVGGRFKARKKMGQGLRLIGTSRFSPPITCWMPRALSREVGWVCRSHWHLLLCPESAQELSSDATSHTFKCPPTESRRISFFPSRVIARSRNPSPGNPTNSRNSTSVWRSNSDDMSVPFAMPDATCMSLVTAWVEKKPC